MSETRLTALKNIYLTQRGYLGELQDAIGEEMLSEFISVGFIICGYTRTKKTWRISNLGSTYIADLGIA